MTVSTQSTISPKVRGFICTTAHPEGCAENVRQQIRCTQAKGQIQDGPKKVLVIGASTGFGLASRINAAFGAQAATIGVSFERPAAGKRTASAGWYNTAAFEKEATQAGLYAKSINGDAFSHEIKQQTIDLIKQDWDGKVDLIIYSIASPRRTDPNTGVTYQSTLKPIGQDYQNKSVDVMQQQITEVSLTPANEEEIANTVRVMGGDDWQAWIERLLAEDCLAPGCKTVAYTYIGPELTHPIYKDGTIGRAKMHLEETAATLNTQLQTIHGEAIISVNKALVTQASAAIPVVPLYISILFKLMKEKGSHEGCIEQMQRLFYDRLYGDKDERDTANRIRLDDWEMAADIQAGIQTCWDSITTDTLLSETDLQGYISDFYQLFGFGVEGVNYDSPVDAVVEIPSLQD